MSLWLLNMKSDNLYYSIYKIYSKKYSHTSPCYDGPVQEFHSSDVSVSAESWSDCMQSTNCACMRSYIAYLTGCLCQSGTQSPLSPLCAIMLILESYSVIISDESRSIVLSSGRWRIEKGKMWRFLLLIQESHSHIERWLTNEMSVRNGLWSDNYRVDHTVYLQINTVTLCIEADLLL